MTRSVVYAAASVALVAATALTITSLLSPNWVSYTIRSPSGAAVTDAIGLHRRCTTSYSSTGAGTTTVVCTRFPEASRCGGDDDDTDDYPGNGTHTGDGGPSFCSMWQTAGFLVSLAVLAELVAIGGIGVVMAGGKARRVAGLAVVAYLFDHDDLFLVPGYRLGSAFYLCAGSAGAAMLAAAGLVISALVLPPEDGYELLKDRSGVLVCADTAQALHYVESIFAAADAEELFDGMVETPARRNLRRKTPVPESDPESASASEAMESKSRSLRRRGAPKFKEHLDESTPPPESPVEAEAKVTTPAKANGNGLAKTTTNTSEYPEDKIIDGWKPGTDPKIDLSGQYEFGGPWFVSVMMIGFPLLMWYMWIGATYYDGLFPTREPGQSWGDFAHHLVHLVYTGAFPHARAWLIYWVFFVVEGAMYCLMPGVWAYGKPLLHEGGKQLKYYCSAYTSFYTTIALVAALHFSGVFPLYTIIDEFGPLLSVSILSGWLVAIVAYISALARGAQHRMSGNHIYDFFMGAELNPRMFGILDFKMFFEVRMPWYILFLISLGAAARQWERYGYVSGEVGFLVLAHYLYANATSKGEELIVTTWDMYYEKWGFMLIFWNLSGVPLSYCHCTIYLANHHPDEYRWNRWALVLLYVSYLFVYWIWDSCNSQKNRFRAMERGTLIYRNTFPQVPWQTIHNPKVIETGLGDKILADGWYGLARKIHYTCDTYFAITWGLITGFKSPFPWFYPVFFTVMIAHRAWRDIHRCREKYGEAWKEYERQVPYLFIPYVF
ncbi:hypothetical protein VTJ49DRAFT_4420 [Mycothermus thermophilus]|uniref:Delta(24(24(1)))-sterol reductase n=1 Tax=Humicola insolens TaxID=85995 RepID=A0ABR3V6E1_HUMIN